ncbi:MAG: ribbon-helix-helix domain-containing protein [Chloroflexota bacterium]
MKRTTIFIDDNLDQLLDDLSQRTGQPRSHLVREALTQYLVEQTAPWPRSLGMGDGPDPSVSSSNVKDWVRNRWLQDSEPAGSHHP